MGLIVELSSTSFCEEDNTTDGSHRADEEQLRDLLPHFYPPHQLDTPKIISLIKYRSLTRHHDEDDDGERIYKDYCWDKHPTNFKNCPEALSKLERFVNRKEKISKDVLGVLVPTVFKVTESHVPEHRLRGLLLMQRLFSVAEDVGYLIRSNVHRVLLDSVLISLTNQERDLVDTCYTVTCGLFSSLSSIDHNAVYDELIERCLFMIVHTQDHPTRLEHWKGLRRLIALQGVPFVRHFHYFFKACEVVASCINEDAELEQLERIFELVTEVLPERSELRRGQMDRVIGRVAVPGK